MPPINRFKCDNCDLELRSGWGGCFYVESYDGKRVACTHPIEDLIIERVLGIPPKTLISLRGVTPKWWWSRERKQNYKKTKAIYDAAYARTGFSSDCMCLDCLERQELDLKKDERKCQKCASINVKSIKELLGAVCPKCKKGIIDAVETGIRA